MKKNIASVAAVTLVIGTMVPSAFASVTSTPQQHKSTISIDNKTLSNPYAFAASDGSTVTTYMPMYYINQALATAGYTTKWDGHTWALSIQDGTPDFSGIAVGTGKTSITLNGKLIKEINTIVQKDPGAGSKAQPTTYIPIYYVQPLFEALGIKNNWDGINLIWNATSPLTLKANQTYGSTDSPSTVDKHIVVTGTGVTIQNTTVNGNIYINPGQDGTVYLKSVTVTGSIVVLSGAMQSIHLQDVTTPQLTIDSTSAVHIVSEGNTQITSTLIPPENHQSITLDQQTGSLGNVTDNASSNLTLTGWSPFSSLSVNGPGAQINLDPQSTISNLNIGNVTGVTVNNNGQILSVTNNATNGGAIIGGPGTIGPIPVPHPPSGLNMTLVPGGELYLNPNGTPVTLVGYISGTYQYDKQSLSGLITVKNGTVAGGLDYSATDHEYRVEDNQSNTIGYVKITSNSNLITVGETQPPFISGNTFTASSGLTAPTQARLTAELDNIHHAKISTVSLPYVIEATDPTINPAATYANGKITVTASENLVPVSDYPTSFDVFGSTLGDFTDSAHLQYGTDYLFDILGKNIVITLTDHGKAQVTPGTTAKFKVEVTDAVDYGMNPVDPNNMTAIVQVNNY